MSKSVWLQKAKDELNFFHFAGGLVAELKALAVDGSQVYLPFTGGYNPKNADSKSAQVKLKNKFIYKKTRSWR